jgi:hypothetical protein
MDNLQLIHNLVRQFTFWRTYTELSSAARLNDVNNTNENLSALLLNKVYGWNLHNLNSEKANFPAIDLGDESIGIGVSVTATDSSTYIKDKIEKNIKYKVYEKYPKHFIFITTKKKNYTTDFDTEGKYSFDKVSNILDIEDLLILVKENPDENQVQDILKILESNVFKLKGQFIDDITPQDIAKVLKEFSLQNPNLIKNISTSIKTIQRTDFPKKNKINKLSEGYIKLIQQESLPFFLQLANFLQQFDNKEFKNIYYNITSDLQKIIIVKRDEFEQFDQIFNIIEATCKEQVPSLLSDRRTLQILLHFMYFQCDIGENKS